MNIKKVKIYFMVLFFAMALLVLGCASHLAPGNKGVKWRPVTFGMDDKLLEEGFYFHLPWNDVLSVSVQWQNFTERVEVLTKDDLHIRIDSSVILRPIAQEVPQLILEIGDNYYDTVVKPNFFTVVRSTMADYTMVEIPKKSPEIENKILEKFIKRIKGKHIELDKVTINHIVFTKGILRAIEEKLAKEQENIQKDFELKIAAKDADIARIKAKGEGDSIKIKAVGEAEAEKIRAVGQAVAQKTINKTLTKKYIQYKAFESPRAKFIYVPTDKDGLPIIVSPEIR